MNRFKLLPCLVAFAVILGVISCKVEGPQGPAGQDGADGNANVKSQIITVTPANWTGNGFIFQALKQCSIITAEIVNSGAVLCYMRSGTSTYVALPFTYTDGYEDEQGNVILYDSHSFYDYSTGAITFYLQDNDAMTPAPTSNIVFKVVAIASSEVVAGLNTANYNEVATALNLED